MSNTRTSRQTHMKRHEEPNNKNTLTVPMNQEPTPKRLRVRHPINIKDLKLWKDEPNPTKSLGCAHHMLLAHGFTWTCGQKTPAFGDFKASAIVPKARPSTTQADSNPELKADDILTATETISPCDFEDIDNARKFIEDLVEINALDGSDFVGVYDNFRVELHSLEKAETNENSTKRLATLCNAFVDTLNAIASYWTLDIDEEFYETFATPSSEIASIESRLCALLAKHKHDNLADVDETSSGYRAILTVADGGSPQGISDP